MADEQTTETPRVWSHQRLGRIVGVVVHEDDEWVTIRCTEPNRRADVGETTMFRRAFATEVA